MEPLTFAEACAFWKVERQQQLCVTACSKDKHKNIINTMSVIIYYILYAAFQVLMKLIGKGIAQHRFRNSKYQ